MCTHVAKFRFFGLGASQGGVLVTCKRAAGEGSETCVFFYCVDFVPFSDGNYQTMA